MFRQSGPGRYRYVLFALVFTLLTPGWQAFAQVATLSIVTGAFSAEGKASTHLPDFLYALTPELFRRIGVEAKLSALPAERALINANSGIDDGDMFRPPGIEKIYPNLIMVPEKLVDFEFIAYSKRPEIKIRNFDDLKPYALGFVRGYKNIESRVTQVREVALVTNTEQLFDLIDNDRVDVIIIGRIGKLANQEALAHRLTAHQPALFSTGMHLYLHQKHAALVPRVAQALKGMKADGSYRKIQDATLNRAITP